MRMRSRTENAIKRIFLLLSLLSQSVSFSSSLPKWSNRPKIHERSSLSFVTIKLACGSSSNCKIDRTNSKSNVYAANDHYISTTNDKTNEYPFNQCFPKRQPTARLIGHFRQEDLQIYEAALKRVGFKAVTMLKNEVHDYFDDDDDDVYDDDAVVYQYRYNSALGMLQLMNDANQTVTSSTTAKLGTPVDKDHSSTIYRLPKSRHPPPPRWITLVMDKESVLISNGWSFLDIDENNPLSPYDIDAANREGLYRPQWGQQEQLQMHKEYVSNDQLYAHSWNISSLGFLLNRMSRKEVQNEADRLLLQNYAYQLSVQVLLEGKTDPTGRKETMNGYSFRGSLCDQEHIVNQGVFVCGIGGLPLFTTEDLSLTATVSSGWLSFVRPISDDHIQYVYPQKQQLYGSKSSFTNVGCSNRIEIVCAKSGCHLGHYFGLGEGYCINASAMNFICSTETTANTEVSSSKIQSLVSYRALDVAEMSPSVQVLVNCIRNSVVPDTIVLGAGCFWHVEYAIRRLSGVVDTCVGYAGGYNSHPTTYDQLCEGTTGHAEVVRVAFDPAVLELSMLLDCFFCMHDPTKVRAHGNLDPQTGQYRSCIYAYNEVQATISYEALERCKRQLDKELSTEVKILSDPQQAFYPAEEYHQRHDEKLGSNGRDPTTTLNFVDWVKLYGKRNDSILGSGNTIDIRGDGSLDNRVRRQSIIAGLQGFRKKQQS